jgi:hypothetical protein
MAAYPSGKQAKKRPIAKISRAVIQGKRKSA